MPKPLLTLFIVTAGAGILPMRAAVANAATGATAAVDYMPFELREIISPATGLPATAAEILKIEVQGKVLFEGPAFQLLAVLNAAEQFYCQQGHSLRGSGPIPWGKILTDSNLLNAQVLNTLRMGLTTLGKLRQRLTECPQIQIEYFGINLKTNVPYRGADVIEVEGNNLDLQSFVDRINDQQDLLCSLGWSIAPSLSPGLGGIDLVRWLLDKRAWVMRELNISKYHPSFNLEVMLPLKTLGEMAADVDFFLSKQKVPGLGDLKAIAAKYDIPVPAALKIPELPDMPDEWKSVEVPQHHELKLLKRKEWKGIDIGDRQRFAALATAYYEVRGSNQKNGETEIGVAAVSEARAAAYIFEREYCALQAAVVLHADERHADGLATLRVAGKDVADFKFDQSVAYTFGRRDLLLLSLDMEATAQFTVGPVPVYVAARAAGQAALGLELGVSPLQIHASLLPSVDVSASVAGGVGFANVLSAGAQGTLVLIALGPTLQGEAVLALQEPALTLGLSADAVYSGLSGSASAFVEYPVPRIGVPPWGVKRANFEIFRWTGFEGRNRIMGWTTKLTPFAMEMSGDIIDQADRAEAQALQQGLDDEHRRRAVMEMRRAAAERKHAVLKALVADLSSESSRRIPHELVVLGKLPEEIEAARVGYLQHLDASLGGGAL